jgi:hypothetical protein
MIIILDPRTLTLNIRTAVNEEYAPTETLKELDEKVKELNKKRELKLEELNVSFEEFKKKEIDPALKELQKEINAINMELQKKALAAQIKEEEEKK